MSVESLRANLAHAKKLAQPATAWIATRAEVEAALREYDSLQLANEQYQSQLRYERNNSESLASKRDKLLELLPDFVDADDCHFDHNGHCQAHGWMVTDPKCPHGRAKEILEAE